MYLLALFYHYNKFLILPPRSGGLCPLWGELMQPFSFFRHLVISLSPSLGRAVPSPAVGCFSLSKSICLCGILCWSLYPSQLLGLCPAIPYSLLLPCAGKAGCELGGWMFLSYEYSMAPSLPGWVAGGELRCSFSALEGLETWNALTWVSPFVS